MDLLEWCVELNEGVYATWRRTTVGKKLEDTVPSSLENNVGLDHYTCQRHFYCAKNYYKQKQVVVPCIPIEEFHTTLKEKLKTC
jgi:hypothetical protein